MNREILFRGKRTDNGEWVYGDLLCNWTVPQILSEEDGNEYLVIPATVGQFTGLTDKNGVKIWEGDIIGDWTDVDGEQVQSTCPVFFEETLGEWMIDVNHGQEMAMAYSLASELNDFDYEVIGNIHDNPELIK